MNTKTKYHILMQGTTSSETALWVVSALSLAANIAVIVYHCYKIFKHNRNPLKVEVYTDLAAYKAIADMN
ncbi:DUF5692 family protein [Paenibacillus auburnensis]|uniref:DUF5692 family protein n=1 Tax=Paenibacillus auburnensis TaxID=2905649 RepID=UPI001F2C84F8|nr:DUF5692 family protein [Paenibacillus auburnensis]